tara:strand:- start:1431 stop:1910 length:480 start_codon:yes stop_codon:yes gene_type:complete
MIDNNYLNFSDLVREDHPYQEQLLWSLENKGISLPWFEISQRKLATKAQGIYKPGDQTYALSAKTVLGSRYDDGEVFVHSTSDEWMVLYRPEESDRVWPNEALKICQIDLSPVIYFKQLSRSPSIYKLVGPCLPFYLAEKSFFLLMGFSKEGTLENNLF